MESIILREELGKVFMLRNLFTDEKQFEDWKREVLKERLSRFYKGLTSERRIVVVRWYMEPGKYRDSIIRLDNLKKDLPKASLKGENLWKMMYDGMYRKEFKKVEVRICREGGSENRLVT